jgi:hypothetical protein
VGSKLKINTSASLSSNSRAFTALDYDGNPINWYAGSTLSLAKCEVRVVLMSDMPASALASFTKRIAKASSLAGWVQPYSDPSNPKVSVANLLVLNDISLNWSTRAPTPLQGLDVETIALHELGHTLGLVHISEKGTVMSGESGDHFLQWLGFRKRALTKTDANLLVKLYGRR